MEIVIYRPDSSSPALDRIRSRGLQMNPGLLARVTEIIEAVRSGGDEALIHFTREFDGISLKPHELRVDRDFIKQAAGRADRRTLEAFRRAAENVRAFHLHQVESSWEFETEDGSLLGQRVLAISSAGLYVPGGRAAYPSTVVMNAVPAQVAGVPRVAIATPPATFDENPMIAALIEHLGIDEVYRVGGAQAIAALAFGTETIHRVDKVVGPGNIYVAAAKKLCYGAVGIDSIAGPTEVIVLADESANPRYVAADLLAQAEHDREASAICVTTSIDLAREVSGEISAQLAQLERWDTAAASIEAYGAIFVVESIESACDLINRIAPEHLELMTSNNEAAAAMVENAGAIFFGDWSPEPVGDYFAGPNHVLPTVATARFASALGVGDFIKRQSVIRYSREALEHNAQAIAAMAESEGLTAHKRSILIRTEGEQSER
jgi:histidinol dehydrogenase